MDGRLGGRESAPHRRTRRALAALALVVGACALAPSGASAETETFKYRLPITVSGYQVKQTVVGGPRPSIDGLVTHMKVDVVDAEGANVNTYPDSTPVPISRLMLHHIVFLNTNFARVDQTCDQIMSFDNMQVAPGLERFFAAGEERAQLTLPDGYGYQMGPQAQNPWAVLYMVMNHQADTDHAFIEYEVTVEKDPTGMQPVKPVWLDANNCNADPIFNVPGTGGEGATKVRSRDFTISETKLGATGGRIIAGAGHVHGGAQRLTLTQPTCGDRELARSVPTWGRKDHPFYNVKPILHEPGPINMTAFKTEQGFPIRAGEPVRLNSVYDNSRPHTRVMGIMIMFVAPDDSIPPDPCPDELQPTDVEVSERPDGRTKGPVKFEVPLTGLDENGQAETILKPPGETKELKSGSTIKVIDNQFTKRNVKINEGDTLNWAFDTDDLHNVTLANGPQAIGSPNLSRYNAFPNDPRVFTKRFTRPGTYRMFCALHPVQMSERVVVKP